MKIQITFTGDNRQGTLEDDAAWNWVQSQIPYNGPGFIKQRANVKEGYRGKNPAGGRKCVFHQSAEYRNGFIDRRSKRKSPNRDSGIYSFASEWFGFTPRYMEHMKGCKRWEVPNDELPI